MNIREGMKVMVTFQMHIKGEVKEIYYVPVQHGSSGGTFSKQIRVKFINESDGKLQDFRGSDLTILRDE